MAKRKITHGGARDGAGRPALPKSERGRAYSVRLGAWHVALLDVLGDVLGDDYGKASATDLVRAGLDALAKQHARAVAKRGLDVTDGGEWLAPHARAKGKV